MQDKIPTDTDTTEVPETTAPERGVTPAKAPVNPGPREIGGPKGPEPTRYGDWEKNGRCIDF